MSNEPAHIKLSLERSKIDAGDIERSTSTNTRKSDARNGCCCFRQNRLGNVAIKKRVSCHFYCCVLLVRNRVRRCQIGKAHLNHSKLVTVYISITLSNNIMSAIYVCLSVRYTIWFTYSYIMLCC